MRSRSLAERPSEARERAAEAAEAPSSSRQEWNQEREKLRHEPPRHAETHRERVQQLVPGLDFKRMVL